jgi:DNA-binding LytR/AlgR family response regulator
MIYKDAKVRLFGTLVFAFFYRHIGERGLFLDLIQTWQYYWDMLACILSTALFWEIAKRVIIYADKHYSWQREPVRRAVFQWLTTFSLVTPVQIALIFLYNFYIVHRPENFDVAVVFYTDVPLVWLLFSVMQLVYAVMYFHAHNQDVENQQFAKLYQQTAEYQQLYVAHEALKAQLAILQERFSPKAEAEKVALSTSVAPPQEQHLLVQQGNALIPLALGEIAYVFKINDFTLIRTFDRKDFGIDITLDKLEEILPKTDFFRLNRQIIVAKKSVKQIKPESYGKLNVELTPACEDEAGVSRTKAQEFRQWLGLNL